MSGFQISTNTLIIMKSWYILLYQLFNDIVFYHILHMQLTVYSSVTLKIIFWVQIFNTNNIYSII